jgi:hypothetical protein
MASLLAATLYQRNPDRNYKLWHIFTYNLVRSDQRKKVSVQDWYTVKSAHVVTSIKQSPVFFYEFNLF